MDQQFKECHIKQVWCGNSNSIPTRDAHKYYKVGSRVECLKKGFGAGEATERRKHLKGGTNSLQNIPYIGEKMEHNFILQEIEDLDELINFMGTTYYNIQRKENLLRSVLVNKNGVINTRAYNSVILYVMSRGIGYDRLPKCHIIKYE